MQLTSTTFAALRNLSTAILVALAACPAALAQITVTNATFPVAGDTLKTVVATNPAILGADAKGHFGGQAGGASDLCRRHPGRDAGARHRQDPDGTALGLRSR